MHLPAQLQQLELREAQGSASAALLWLALEHVTGLTSLSVLAALCVDGGVLPRGLHALTVSDVSDTAPVLQLEQLTALQLEHYSGASAKQLRQLSTLTRLEQLSVDGDDEVLHNADASFYGALPLTHLRMKCHELTASCLDHLAACTRDTAAAQQLQPGSRRHTEAAGGGCAWPPDGAGAPGLQVHAAVM